MNACGRPAGISISPRIVPRRFILHLPALRSANQILHIRHGIIMRHLAKRRLICYIVIAHFTLSACNRSSQLCENSDFQWTAPSHVFDQSIDVLHLRANGTISFNGAEMDEKGLSQQLHQQGLFYMSPRVVLRHDKGVPCWEVVEMRSLMRRTLECEFGKCSEGEAWDWVPEGGSHPW